MVTTDRQKNYTMVTYSATATTQEAANLRRIARQEQRRERQRAHRSRMIRNFLLRLLYWLELLPRRIVYGTLTTFYCFIILMLLAAVFLMAWGLLELALSFWSSCIPRY